MAVYNFAAGRFYTKKLYTRLSVMLTRTLVTRTRTSKTLLARTRSMPLVSRTRTLLSITETRTWTNNHYVSNLLCLAILTKGHRHNTVSAYSRFCSHCLNNSTVLILHRVALQVHQCLQKWVTHFRTMMPDCEVTVHKYSLDWCRCKDKDLGHKDQDKDLWNKDKDKDFDTCP